MKDPILFLLQVNNSLHHARQVALGLDVLANAEVSWSLLEERVLDPKVSKA